MHFQYTKRWCCGLLEKLDRTLLMKFIVMDNQAAFDESPYPACVDQNSCKRVCDMMNWLLEGQ